MAAPHLHLLLVLSLALSLCLFPDTARAQLRQNYYASSCPRVESIVRGVVQNKIKQTFVTIPATLRLFFHDCFVQGCDASVIVSSTATNKAEKDHSDNLSNKVSCADILAIATRDVIALSGGPSYPVELGRLDGLSSTAASVNGKLPQPTFTLNQLTAYVCCQRTHPNRHDCSLSGTHAWILSL
ncbi:PEROXIDASE [Salix koriyanagi]|uniref:peroxidase n=1 Tax=Salix koriyanagi TaxID=2511006 RepID=A0A9Q0ZG70_9ROSI|nr:PEROXIDASE [Salix koriyanagi]